MRALEVAYAPNGLVPVDIQLNAESQVYGALVFTLLGKQFQYRVAKITPTKPGHFVAIWKRAKGQTTPYHVDDPIDFLVISVRDDMGFGQFVFPKSVLKAKGIITTHDKLGKRGMRVYAPWVVLDNQQALRTQTWQKQYFCDFGMSHQNDCSEMAVMLESL